MAYSLQRVEGEKRGHAAVLVKNTDGKFNMHSTLR